MTKRKDDLESHLLHLCAELSYETFFDLCAGLPDFSDTLHDRLVDYARLVEAGENPRRPINQDRMLDLRDGLLTHLEQKEMAQDEGIRLDLFTDAQQQAAKDIVAADPVRPRQRIITDVLTMPAPPGVSISLDEHGRVTKYAGHLPAYAAYALIDHFKD